MKSGYMYMMPFDSPYYALIPTRRWYAPWLWDLACVEWLDARQGQVRWSGIRPLASNLRRAETFGMMRILGAINLEN